MADERGSARSCELCLSWSVLYWTRICAACRSWKRTYPKRGTCPRCRHEAHLNTDGLCRPCLQAIRAEEDTAWALGLDNARPRDLQLLVLSDRDRVNKARPLVRGSGTGSRPQQEWRRKLRRQREIPDERPIVLEPVMRGQIPLFILPRILTEATVSALVRREVAGWERAREALTLMEAEHGLSVGWRYQVAEMVRLPLRSAKPKGLSSCPRPCSETSRTIGMPYV